MKYIDSYELFENNNPSMEELSNFYKDLMAGKTQMQQHRKNYKIDTDKVKNLVKDIVMTPELIAILTKRKITVPDPSKIRMKVDKTPYHRKFVYTLSDSPLDPDEERFNVTLSVEVPFGEEFEADNTMVSGSVWIKRHGRFKELHGYSNKRIQKDEEFNYFSAGAVLQNAYQELISQQ